MKSETVKPSPIRTRATEPMRRLALTVPEAAAVVGVSAPIVREWLAMADGLPHIQIGKKTIIRVDALDSFLQRLEQR